MPAITSIHISISYFEWYFWYAILGALHMSPCPYAWICMLVIQYNIVTPKTNLNKIFNNKCIKKTNPGNTPDALRNINFTVKHTNRVGTRNKNTNDAKKLYSCSSIVDNKKQASRCLHIHFACKYLTFWLKINYWKLFFH